MDEVTLDPLPEKRQPLTKLSELVPPEWINPAVYGEVIMNFYTSALARGSEAREAAEAMRGLIRAICDHPIACAFVTFGQDNEHGRFDRYSVYSNGELNMRAIINRETLPAGDYIVFLSPVQRTAEGGTYQADADRALDVARGAFMALAGHAAAEQLLWHIAPSIDALETARASSGIFELFDLPDDFLVCSANSIKSLARKAATHLPAERRERLGTALTFLARAVAEMDATVRFSHFWIALEVAAGGAGKIDGLIRNVSGSEAGRQGLAAIKDARDDLFHNGRRYALTCGQERLMCAAIIAGLFDWYRIEDPRLAQTISELGSAPGEA